MIGVRLGAWVIDEEIGRGGMGAVYRASRAEGVDDGPERVAIKVLAAELALEVGFQQRFQREIDILRQLDHPNIVRLFDHGSSNGRFWYAMEYVEGPSYDDLRDPRGRLPWLEVLDLAWQVAPALKHLHDRGVIHRDLKPSNLLRATEPDDPQGPGLLKLTDFGIASLFASPHLTVTGGVIGTPEFLSPEQASGKPVTRRSDLYSLGIVLYTLVTGTPPFTGDPIDLLHKHRFGQFDRPGRIVPEIHPDFEEIICKLLAKDPGERPGDAGVLFRRLDSLRKKIIRQRQGVVEQATALPGTPASGREGPATMVSRLVREELRQQQQGGPIKRFVNQPVVLVVLFALCVGVLAWTFWPMSAARLFAHGATLMASEQPEDWERAWDRYLEPLERKYPDHPYQAEVEEFRQRYQEYRAERQATRLARWKPRLGEGQWFFEKGVRLRRQGDEAGARRVWKALVEAFRDVATEKPWVRRAEKALQEKPPGPDDEEWAGLRQALKRAQALEAQGHKDEAQAIRQALADLYRDDPAAGKLLKGP